MDDLEIKVHPRHYYYLKGVEEAFFERIHTLLATRSNPPTHASETYADYMLCEFLETYKGTIKRW